MHIFTGLERCVCGSSCPGSICTPLGSEWRSDHHVGSYSWLVCLRTPHRTIIAARGSGRIPENDSLNALMQKSPRPELRRSACSLACTLRKGGRAVWNGKLITHQPSALKLNCPGSPLASGCNNLTEMYIYGNTAWIQPQLLTRNMGYLSPKVTRRRPKTKS
jgi:hypothetical protein